MPVGPVAALCRRHGCFLLVDAAQACGAVDVAAWLPEADAVAIAGHKSLYGPTGTGALYLREPDTVSPFLHGGTGSRSESEEQPDFPPDKFEAGTLNVPGLAGLAAGVRHVRSLGLETVARRNADLLSRLLAALRKLPEVTIHGPCDPLRQLPVVSFVVRGHDPGVLGRELDLRDVLCRPGLHCASRAHRTLGTFPAGTVRFSLSVLNTEAEIDEAVGALRGIVQGSPSEGARKSARLP